MRTQPLGRSPLVASCLSYGCMRVAGGGWDPAKVTADDRAHGRRAILAAFDAGYTLFDHADIYCRGVCEQIFGDTLRDTPAMRGRVLVATKCGIRFGGDPDPDSPHRYDFSAGHIQQSCEQSLRRLGVETIDLYQLHRPDVLMDPAEVAGAFDLLKRQGKVREFGVSNFTPSQVTALQSACPAPLAVNQVQVHLGDLHCFNDGTLDQCLARTMTPLAWSPLGGGYLGAGGVVPDRNPRKEGLVKLQALLDEIAAQYNVSRTVISLAWLLRHPSKMIPIVGSTDPANIRDAAGADGVNLNREDWYRLLVAARMEPLP